MAGKRRRFGWIRKLPSGRFQASYLGPNGQRYPAPDTFARRSDAEKWLNLKELQLQQSEWIDPERAKIKLSVYGPKWIEERPKLRTRTRELYAWLFVKHIAPGLGNITIGALTTPMVRQWRARLLAAGLSEVTAAKAYRLLRAIMWTAVKEDKLRLHNPCNIRSADREDSPERPVLTVEQISELAELACSRPLGNITKRGVGQYRLRYTANGRRQPHPNVFATRKAADAELWRLGYAGDADVVRDGRFRALVLLAAYASLRYGEVTALRRRDVDLRQGLIHVRTAYVELRDGTMLVGPPKSKAGLRTIAIPARITAELTRHMDSYTATGRDALVFTTAEGRPLRRSNFQKFTGWTYAAEQIGMPGLHFHDLRHTGNTMAADIGTSTKNLMARMGHDNEKAALRYQHRSAEADQAIADALDGLLAPGRAGNRSVKKPADQELAAKLRALLADHLGPDESDDDGAAGAPAKVA